MLVTLREPPNEITQLHAAEAARVVLAQVVQLREQAGAGLADDAKCCVPALQQLLPQGGLAPHTWPLETMPATIVVVVQHDGALHADDEVQEQRRAGLGHSYVVERLAARLEAPGPPPFEGSLKVSVSAATGERPLARAGGEGRTGRR